MSAGHVACMGGYLQRSCKGKGIQEPRTIHTCLVQEGAHTEKEAVGIIRILILAKVQAFIIRKIETLFKFDQLGQPL